MMDIVKGNFGKLVVSRAERLGDPGAQGCCSGCVQATADGAILIP
jgi:hypothetical protein